MTKSNIYIIFLKFSKNKAKASIFMKEHIKWLEKGFKENVFLLSGTLQDNTGGSIVAYNTPFRRTRALYK